MSDLLNTGFMIALFAATFRMVTPILFASTGLMVVERGGILDLSIEGVMMIGALIGFAATYHTGSLWLGVLIGALTGGIISLFTSFLIVVLKINQSVSGLSVNLLAIGLSLYLFRVMFGREGYVVPTIKTFDPLQIPLLHKIPVIGDIIFSQYALTYLAFILVIAVWIFIYKTKHGLIIRCMGDNPHTVDTKGINVNLLHTILLFFGGMMYGMGGAFLPLVSTGMYVQGITAGRGWIALVLVIFGNYKPFPIMLGALLFGFLDALQLQIQSIGIDFPYQALMALPYLLTLIVLVVGSKKSAKPLHLGIPYHRE